MSTIQFYSPSEAYYEFSNYYCEKSRTDLVVWNGHAYASSEHAYQCAKFSYPGASEESEQYAEIIRTAKTPNMARVYASQKTGGGYKWRTDMNETIRQYQHIPMRENWDAIKVSIMQEILLCKFQQNEHLKRLLLSTQSSSIEENSPRDPYWGIGKNGDGLNKLGTLLMDTRRQLM